MPNYDSWLSAYHKAFSKDLQKIVSDLPICTGDRILDVGCGDGTFSEWMAPLVVPEGQVVGLDLSGSLIKKARQRIRGSRYGRHVRFIVGDVNRLPFEESRFDVVWSAQNLFSFPDPKRALREMVRVLKPRGVLALLENDSLHQILLPWPVDLELDLLTAEHRSFCGVHSDPDKFYIARQLRRLLRSVGIQPQRKKVYALQREVPFTHEELEFLRLYLKGLQQRAKAGLLGRNKKAILEILNPRSSRYILNDPELTLTCIDQVAWGKKIG